MAKKKEVIDLTEVVNELIKNATHFGAGGVSITFVYPDGWDAKIEVTRRDEQTEEEDEKAE